MNIQQLSQAEPELWNAAANDWIAMAKHCWDASQALRTEATTDVAPTWVSRSGDLAVGRMTAQADVLESAFDEMRGAASVLDGLAEAVGVAQRSLQSALAHATANGLKVDQASGEVTFAASPQLRKMDTPQERQAEQQTLTDTVALIDNALKAATDADTQAAAGLRHVAGTTGITDPAAAVTDVQKNAAPLEVQLIADTVPPKGSDPAVVAAWWAGLTPKEQQDLQLAVPASLAHLDGIPAGVQAELIGTDGKFDRSKFVQWSIDHWNDTGIDVEKDNCTNFASTGLHAAGLQYYNDGWGTLHDGNWVEGGQTGWGWLDGHDKSHSYAWGGAQNMHDFLMAHGSTEIPISQVKPGDIIFFQQAQGGHDGIPAGTVHHTMVVTSVTPDGDVHYTQHDSNLANASLNTRMPSENINEGQQNLKVVRVQPDW